MANGIVVDPAAGSSAGSNPKSCAPPALASVIHTDGRTRYLHQAATAFQWIPLGARPGAIDTYTTVTESDHPWNRYDVVQPADALDKLRQSMNKKRSTFTLTDLNVIPESISTDAATDLTWGAVYGSIDQSDLADARTLIAVEDQLHSLDGAEWLVEQSVAMDPNQGCDVSDPEESLGAKLALRDFQGTRFAGLMACMASNPSPVDSDDELGASVLVIPPRAMRPGVAYPFLLRTIPMVRVVKQVRVDGSDEIYEDESIELVPVPASLAELAASWEAKMILSQSSGANLDLTLAGLKGSDPNLPTQVPSDDPLTIAFRLPAELDPDYVPQDLADQVTGGPPGDLGYDPDRFELRQSF